MVRGRSAKALDVGSSPIAGSVVVAERSNASVCGTDRLNPQRGFESHQSPRRYIGEK